ncbi:MAG TPA: hypothetical protein VGM88_16905 [Kofleriaceae bacterium]|jgi:hypothetical protein
MTSRRFASVLSVCVFATASVVAAQPKKSSKKGPVAPAKDPTPAAPAPAPADGSGSGSAVQMTEDPPPSDDSMNGTNENPDAPKGLSADDNGVKPPPVAPVAVRAPGYPIEEALRPITLPQNMSEISIDPHTTVSPADGTVTLRARYGITRQVQIGLRYVLAGLYDDPNTISTNTGFHTGKTVGLDVTYLIQDWIGVSVGVPFYLDPVAVGLTVGVPLKFHFSDKFALGALDDLLLVKIHKFAPDFNQELDNASGKARDLNNTGQPDGALRFSLYGTYQYTPQFAIVARFGIAIDDFSSTMNDAGYGGLTTFLRGGFQYSPKRYLDLGLQIGFDDLAHGGTFSPYGFLAIRI